MKLGLFWVWTVGPPFCRLHQHPAQLRCSTHGLNSVSCLMPDLHVLSCPSLLSANAGHMVKLGGRCARGPKTSRAARVRGENVKTRGFLAFSLLSGTDFVSVRVSGGWSFLQDGPNVLQSSGLKHNVPICCVLFLGLRKAPGQGGSSQTPQMYPNIR